MRILLGDAERQFVPQGEKLVLEELGGVVDALEHASLVGVGEEHSFVRDALGQLVEAELRILGATTADIGVGDPEVPSKEPLGRRGWANLRDAKKSGGDALGELEKVGAGGAEKLDEEPVKGCLSGACAGISGLDLEELLEDGEHKKVWGTWALTGLPFAISLA